MTDRIDLDVIIESKMSTYDRGHAKIKGSPDYEIKEALKEAIYQALVLASEKATVEEVEVNTGLPMPKGGDFKYKKTQVRKQSILDVGELII